MTSQNIFIRAIAGVARGAMVGWLIAVLTGAPAFAQGSFPGTGAQPVKRGGTGKAALTQNNLIFGNGTAPVGFLSPAGFAGRCVVSDGTIWAAQYCLVTGSIVGTAPVTVNVTLGAATVALTIDSNFDVISQALALKAIPSGNLIANGAAGTAEPTSISPSNYLDRALGSSNSGFAARIGGTWGQATFGTGLGFAGSVLNLQPAAAGAIGGVNSIAQVAHQWVQYIDTNGLPHQAQPGFADLATGTASCAQLPALAGGVTSTAGSCVTTVVTNANLTGDVTSSGNATTLTNAPVIAKVLTGFTSGAGAVTAADSILSALQKINGNAALLAPLASPALTGTPTAPTQTFGDNTTKIATDAFVQAAVIAGASGVASLGGATGALDIPFGVTSGRPVTNADCENPLLLGGDAQFTMTVNAPSTYTCDRFKFDNVDVYTGPGTGRGKLIAASLVNLLTSFWLMPGQHIELIADGASLWQTDRQVVSVDGVGYVPRWATNAWQGFVNSGASASDSTQDGLADGTLGAGSFATIHHCINFLFDVVDHQGNQPTCAPKTGQTFADNNVSIVGKPVGTNGFWISGNGGQFTWTATQQCATVSDGANVIFQTMILNCNSGNTANTGALFLHQDVIIDTMANVTVVGNGSHASVIECDSNCRVNIDNGLTLSGTFNTEFHGGAGSNFNVNNTTAASGTVTIAQFYGFANLNSSIALQGNVAYTGTFTGPRQWSVLNNSVLCNLGATVPGTAGITSSTNFANGFVATACQ